MREDLDVDEIYECSERELVRESIAESVAEADGGVDVEAAIEVVAVEEEPVEMAPVEDVTVEGPEVVAEVTADAKNSLPSYERFKKMMPEENSER